MWVPGLNWLIDDQSDSPVPAAKFRWDPLMVNYSSALESSWINAAADETAWMPALSGSTLILNWMTRLHQPPKNSAWKSGTAWDWITAHEYPNTGNFEWARNTLI